VAFPFPVVEEAFPFPVVEEAFPFQAEVAFPYLALEAFLP